MDRTPEAVLNSVQRQGPPEIHRWRSWAQVELCDDALNMAAPGRAGCARRVGPVVGKGGESIPDEEWERFLREAEAGTKGAPKEPSARARMVARRLEETDRPEPWRSHQPARRQRGKGWYAVGLLAAVALLVVALDPGRVTGWFGGGAARVRRSPWNRNARISHHRRKQQPNKRPWTSRSRGRPRCGGVTGQLGSVCPRRRRPAG